MKKLTTLVMTLLALAVAGPVTAEHEGVERGPEIEKVRPVPDEPDPYYPHRPAPRPAVHVDVWTDRGEGAQYCTGEPIRIFFRASRDAYVTVYDLDTRGRVNVLFPSGPYDDNYVRGGHVYELGGYGWHFEVEGPRGWEHLRAVASLDPRAAFRRGERPRLWDDRWEASSMGVDEFDEELDKRVVPVPDRPGHGHGPGHGAGYSVTETSFYVRDGWTCDRYRYGRYPRVHTRRPW